jgi:tRNA pseudouridine55 synthase
MNLSSQHSAPSTQHSAGFLNICKERGFTSHDVVARVRRIFGVRRVGHAGTLDPAAEGVLPICVGRATRLVDRLAGSDKEYYAVVALGVGTRTDDAEGEVIATGPVPPLDSEVLETVLDRFRGRLLQRPPAFSAVKVDGRRAYSLARRGDEVSLRPREVTVHRLALHRWRPPELALTIACTKGTYIRAIARDLGEALGCGAHLARLVRLRVGPFRLADAHSLDELAAGAETGRLERYLLSPDAALGDLPAAIVEPGRAADIRHGRAWPMGRPLPQPPEAHLFPPTRGRGQDGLTRVYDTDGLLLGLASADRERRIWQPRLALTRTDE